MLRAFAHTLPEMPPETFKAVSPHTLLSLTKGRMKLLT